MAQVAGTVPIKNNLAVTGAASVTAVGVGQRIEQLNCYDLAGSTATLSVNISNTLLTTVTWTASYATSADTWSAKTQIATGTFTVTSSLVNYTANISIPSAATTGIEILFTVGAQISGTWTIGNVQLEAGSTASPFEYRSYGVELALCQRYFVELMGGTNGYQPLGIGNTYSTTQGSYIVYLPVPMRTSTPSLTTAGNIYLQNLGSINISSFAGPYSQKGTIVEGDFTMASAVTANITSFMRFNNVNTSTSKFNFSAEL